MNTYTVDLLENSFAPTLLRVPVTINENVYSFLFDTGTSYNVIDSVIAQKLELNTDSIHLMRLPKIDGTVRADSIAFAHKKYSIGNLNIIHGLFALNGCGIRLIPRQKNQ
jgi:hypothetical protein